MRVVDEALFEVFEASGFWVPERHEDEDPAPVKPANATEIHDGFLVTDTNPEGSVVITYDLPYAVYYSSVGMDANRRLSGRRGRRSVFFSLTYVGLDRAQAKWTGERLRNVLQDKRIAVPGHRTWLCTLEESQRVRRDDDAIRPDGAPLFYGVDDYALSITLTH